MGCLVVTAILACTPLKPRFTRAGWARAAADVQVIKLVPATVIGGNEEDLRRVFANLRQRNIALGVEFGLL